MSREQLARLDELTPINTAVTLSVVLLILAFVAAQGSAPWIYVWAAAQAGLILLVFLRWRKRYRLPADVSEFYNSPTHWALRRKVMWAALSGGLWGCLTAFLPDAPPHIQLLLILTMGGMAAGASATLAAVPQVAIIFILGCGIPVTAYHLVLGDQTGLVLALVFAVFTAAMIGTSQVVSVAVMRQLRAEERVRQLQEADLLRGIAEKANAALRENEQRFRDYTEASSDWVWEMNADLRFTYVSGNVERTLGVAPEWHYGKTREDLLGDDYDRDAWAKHVEALREHRPFRNFEFFRIRDGVDPVWVRSSGVPLFAEDGAFLGYRGTGSDITERMRVEEELRRAEETKRALLTSSEDAIYLLSRDGIILEVNVAGAKRFNKHVDEMLGRSIYDYLPSEFAQSRAAGLARLDAGDSLDFEDFRDGMWLENRVHPVSFVDGKVQRFAVFSRDITARKRMEEQLREREEYYRSLIENSLDFFAVLAADGTIKYQSPSIESQLGHKVEELVGANVLDLLHPDDHEHVAMRFGELAREQGGAASAEFRIRHKDGSWRVMASRARNALATPAIQGIVVNTRDITERKWLEEHLAETQKMEALGQLAGGMAHELNNLLHPVINLSELVKRHLPETSDKSKQHLDTVIDSARKATDVVRNVLMFARKHPSQWESLNFAELVRDGTEFVRTLLPKSITIAVDFEDGDDRVEVDATEVTQVLTNLLTNAAYAMNDGGRITVSLERVGLQGPDATDLELPDGRYMLLQVADAGCGMDDATRARIFEPFFTTKPLGEGTGLGLSVSYGIVRSWGGQITVDSTVGTGSEFRIYVPVLDAAERAPV